METIEIKTKDLVKRAKQLKGEILAKYSFYYDCNNCKTEQYFDSVKIKGLEITDKCKNCGHVSIFIMDGDQSGYKTRENTLKIYNGVQAIFNEYGAPLTVRQVFYQLSSRGLVDKTENGYRQAQNVLKEMRFKGIIPFNYFADNTRYQIKPDSYDGLTGFLDSMQDFYRRDFWKSQNTYIQIWVEKDALRSVFAPITQKYDIPLMVARGYSSLTFLTEASEEIRHFQRKGKTAYIYQFGDYDPSGVNAGETIQETFEILCPGVYYERAALTPGQIEAYELQTRPTKGTDTRIKSFGTDESCELDAMPPDALRQLITNCIEQHIDPQELERHKATETVERESLKHFNDNYKNKFNN